MGPMKRIKQHYLFFYSSLMEKKKGWNFWTLGGVTPVALRAPSVTPPARIRPLAVHLKKRGKWS